MIASTPAAMKLLIWSSCLPTSLPASSTCSSTPSRPAAWSIMPLRSTVRKLSLNSAIDTPIDSAMALVDIRPAKPARIRVFFIRIPPRCGVRLAATRFRPDRVPLRDA
jgi:hypothetical protein